MANTPSAKKRVRQLARKTEVEESIVAGDSGEAQSAFKLAQPEIQRGVTKGIFHRNTASRKISRLLKRVKAVAT